MASGITVLSVACHKLLVQYTTSNLFNFSFCSHLLFHTHQRTQENRLLHKPHNGDLWPHCYTDICHYLGDNLCDLHQTDHSCNLKRKIREITHKLQILSCKYNAIGICDKNIKKMSSWSYWHILVCSYCESQGSGPSSQAYICHTSDHPPRGDSHTPCFWGHRSSAGSQPCSSHSSLSTERSQIE